METFAIHLTEMNMDLAKAFFNRLQKDSDLVRDPSQIKLHEYEESAVEAYVNRQKALGRIHFAVMFRQKPIGEILLKNSEPGKCCTLASRTKGTVQKQNDRPSTMRLGS